MESAADSTTGPPARTDEPPPAVSAPGRRPRPRARRLATARPYGIEREITADLKRVVRRHSERRRRSI